MAAEQVVSLIGMALVLIGFWMVQSKRFAPDSDAVSVANILGSGMLLVVAIDANIIGLILLNAAWVTISLNTFVGKGNN